MHGTFNIMVLLKNTKVGNKMNVKSTAISSFSKFILGGITFNKIRDIVSIYQRSTLSGQEKRSSVIKDVEDLGLGIASWEINLGIEFSVSYFKTLEKRKVRN